MLFVYQKLLIFNILLAIYVRSYIYDTSYHRFHDHLRVFFRRRICSKYQRSSLAPLFQSKDENGDEFFSAKLDVDLLQERLSELRQKLQQDGLENREEIFYNFGVEDLPTGAWESGSSQFTQEELRKKVKAVWVLLFNSGSDDEGIYSQYADGKNVILGWQSKRDAQIYAMSLATQLMFAPQPTELHTQEALSFCEESNFEFEIVPEGCRFAPPETNKPEFDYDPSLFNIQPNKGIDDTIFSAQDFNEIRSDLNKLFYSSDDE